MWKYLPLQASLVNSTPLLSFSFALHVPNFTRPQIGSSRSVPSFHLSSIRCLSVCGISPSSSLTVIVVFYLSAPSKVRSGDVADQDQYKIRFTRRARIFHSSVSLLSSQQLPKGLPVARIFHSHHIIIIKQSFSSSCSNFPLLCLASFFPTNPRRSACSESP